MHLFEIANNDITKRIVANTLDEAITHFQKLHPGVKDYIAESVYQVDDIAPAPIDEYNYFVTFLEKQENNKLVCIHATGYETYPTVADLKALFKELTTDDDFNMGGTYVSKLLIDILSKETFGKILDRTTDG